MKQADHALGYLALALMLVGLALLPAPGGWRLGIALFVSGLWLIAVAFGIGPS